MADASPVIGAAWWWHGWSDTDYDQLAGTLIAGHLIECSAYATGSNFSGFIEYDLENFVDLPFGIAEVAGDGSSVITKHENTKGLVNADNIICQFLYELQGSIYLNSDVTANAKDLHVEQVGRNRVKLSNVKGYPPPPTTKLAIFYHGGYESQLLFNATGYGTKQKYELLERQLKFGLKQKGLLDKFQLLDFQVLGTPAPNPRSQFESTTYLRCFAQADKEVSPEFLDTLSTELKIRHQWLTFSQIALYSLLKTFSEFGMQHFSGFHLSLDTRTALPRSYLAFYPALKSQDELTEGVALLDREGNIEKKIEAGHPSQYKRSDPRENYETADPIDLASLGETSKVRLGDVVLARSGDKGANINIGLFVRKESHYPWLKSFLTRDKMQALMGEDWRPEYFIERCEFPNILAVHFVIYGPLGRGVSSCRLLDALGKGFADYIRDKVVEVPTVIIGDMEGIKDHRRANL